MMPLRIRTVALVIVLAALASSCERISVGPALAGGLHRGRSFAAELIASARATPSQRIPAATAIALGYLERQRLALGSPFRLIDYTLRDARLSDSTRTALAWALLARTLDGDENEIDPTVLDSLTYPGAAAGEVDGREHVSLIEHAIQDARDPRAGELAVRLAYTTAAAERRLRSGAPLLAARVAALVRDRELARADARELLRVARERDADPLAMIPVWRAEHRFTVERPPMERLPSASELEAMQSAPRLVARIASLEPRSAPTGAASVPALTSDSAVVHAMPSLLGNAAARLADLAHRLPAPPEAPVIVPLSGFRAEMLGAPGLTRRERWARYRFVTRARNEEALAAEHALVSRRSPGLAVARATIAAAVALRAYDQESPWLPGDRGPSVAELASRFGLSAVTFDSTTPDRWKPYYLTMLAAALEDLERVVPSLDLDGLQIRFGDSPMRGAALAMHDPRRRTIYFPLATSAGTFAHELAHDIDWQAARTRYAVRGDYATDRAVRDARGGQLAASMRGLTAASVTSATDVAPREPLSARPTEVFARSVDWFVAVSLAREGRSDGYLSSVQDDLLTGYVAVTPPDVTGEAGSALISILDDVAPPTRSLRDWFLTRYGPGRALTPYDLVRRVLEARAAHAMSDTASLAELVTPVLRARDAALTIVDAQACAPGASRDGEPMLAARRRLIELAARARARGIVRDHGTLVLAQGAWRWAVVAPYPATPPLILADALRPALVTELAAGARAVDTTFDALPPVDTSAATCHAIPFTPRS